MLALCLCRCPDNIEGRAIRLIAKPIETQAGRQTSVQTDRQADCEAYRSSGVQRSNHSRQPAQFGLQGVSLCSASSNNTASSLYFSIWGFQPPPPPNRILQDVLLYVTILCAVRLYQSRKAWQLSQLCIFAFVKQMKKSWLMQK